MTAEPAPPVPASRPNRLTWVRWLLAAALIILGAYRALRDIVGIPTPTESNSDATLGADFRDATYFPIKEFFAGGQPYEPSAMLDNWPVRQEFGMYAPLHLILNAPYTLLDYQLAILAFDIVALALLFASAFLVARRFRVPGGPSAWAIVGGLVLMTQWAKWNVYAGQILPLVAFGVTLALLHTARRPWLAAVGVALAWTKPQFAIPLVILLLFRRQWREALGGTLLGGLASLPAGIIVIIRAGGIPQSVAMVQRNLSWSRGAEYSAIDSASGARVDLASAFARTTGLTPWWLELLTLLLILGTAGYLLCRRPGRPLNPPELLLLTISVQLSIYHIVNEGVIHLAGVIGIVCTWWWLRSSSATGHSAGGQAASGQSAGGGPAGRFSGYTLLVLPALGVLIPALFLHNVADLLRAALGDLGFSLIEPGLLVLAFFSLERVLSRGSVDDEPEPVRPAR